MGLTENQIQSIRKLFSDKPVVRAYLFGSYVRGKVSPKSDIDILVDLDYSVPIGLEFVNMALDLENLLEKNMDMVSSKGISKYIIPYIEKGKKLIYERKAG